jgi:hypothetical protein
VNTGSVIHNCIWVIILRAELSTAFIVFTAVKRSYQNECEKKPQAFGFRFAADTVMMEFCYLIRQFRAEITVRLRHWQELADEGYIQQHVYSITLQPNSVTGITGC